MNPNSVEQSIVMITITHTENIESVEDYIVETLQSNIDFDSKNIKIKSTQSF